jgi:hypothetical protein
MGRTMGARSWQKKKKRQRRTQFFSRHAPPQPSDRIEGMWTREELIKMDTDFAVRLESAIARGEERQQAEHPERRYS